jgi:hypothetical protein
MWTPSRNRNARRKEARRVSAIYLWPKRAKGFEPSTPTFATPLQESTPHVSRSGPSGRSHLHDFLVDSGAGEGIRTLDPNLGKVTRQLGKPRSLRFCGSFSWPEIAYLGHLTRTKIAHCEAPLLSGCTTDSPHDRRVGGATSLATIFRSHTFCVGPPFLGDARR